MLCRRAMTVRCRSRRGSTSAAPPPTRGRVCCSRRRTCTSRWTRFPGRRSASSATRKHSRRCSHLPSGWGSISAAGARCTRPRRCTAPSTGFGWMGPPPSWSSSRVVARRPGRGRGHLGGVRANRRGRARPGARPSGAVSRSRRRPRVRRSVRRAWVAAVPERAVGAGRSRPDGRAHRVVAPRRGHGLARRVRRPWGRAAAGARRRPRGDRPTTRRRRSRPLFDGRAMQLGYG